ncbi:MAG: PAS domain S-box protein [Burkholderiales bacterium]
MLSQLSIRTRILLAVGVAALPLAMIVVSEAWRARLVAEAEILERAGHRAGQVAARIDDRIVKVDAMLTTLSRSLSTRRADPDQARALLLSLIAELPAAFEGLRISGPDGMPIAHTNGARGSIADRRFFRAALAGTGLAFGEPTRVFGSDDWSLGLARRIVGEGGDAVGVVSLSTRLSGLQELLDDTGLPSGAVISLLDERGVVLAHTREFATWVGRKLDDASADQDPRGRAEVAVRTARDGAEWLAAHASMSAAPWHVHINIPARGAFAQIHADFMRSLVWLALALLLATLIAWHIGTDMARPLGRLAGDLAHFGGDSTHRSMLKQGGEIGAAVAAFNSMAEATARRETDLREGAAKFRAMVEASPVGIFLAQSDGQTIYCNPAYLRILGLSADEALGLGWIKAIHPEDRDLVAAEWHKAAGAGIPYRGQGRYLHAGGRIVWWQVRSAELRVAAQVVGMVGIAEDITEVREAQSALHDSERRYRSMFASNPQPMWVYDVETLRFLDVNDAAVAHYGYSRDEFRAMTVQDIRLDEDRTRLDRLGGQRAGAALGQGTRRHRRKNGRTIEVELTSHDLMFNGRRAIHVLANDVSERSRVEREIKQINVELEERVAARTVELTAANNELEAFTYSVAHDLRAPLRGIDGFSALLVENNANLDRDAATYAARIRSASQRMGSMISDLLNLSRVSRRDLYKLSVDLSVMVHEIREELARSAPGRAVDWHVQPGLRALGDPGLLRLVLDNLIGNAWKYSRDAQECRIEFGRANGPDGKPEFFVRDNGVGFDMQYAGKLFSVFQRLHSAEKYEGTGIGLATVKRIISRHGGTVRGEATAGHGATFYFTLPD